MKQSSDAVVVAEELTADVFHEVLDLAIKGKGKLPGAKHSAKQLLLRHNDAEAAIRAMVNSHIAMAGGQGFATNWGGFFVSLLTIPANLAAASFLQARLVAGIAHLRGYELDDPRVRTALLMMMLGPGGNAELMEKGTIPSSAAMVATAPVFDAHLDGQVCKALLDRAMNAMTGKRLGVWVGKKIPFVGGGVGAAVDGWATRQIAMHALEQLPSRRPKLGRGIVENVS